MPNFCSSRRCLQSLCGSLQSIDEEFCVAGMKNIAVPIDLDWPYRRHHEVFAGIQAYSEEVGNWNLMADWFPEASLVAGGPGPKYDGVVGRIRRETRDAVDQTAVPAVNVWLGSGDSRGPAVFPDHASAGRMAVEHLVARGLRRLAHIGYRADRASALNGKGVKEAAKAQGVSCTRHICSFKVQDGLQKWQDFCRLIEDWEREWKPPFGLCFSYDNLARLFTSIAKSFGWRIPGEFMLLGGQNEALICNSAVPTLSSIDLAYFQVGYEAAKLLDGLMHGAEPPEEPIYVPPSEVILRQSTDLIAVDDADLIRALCFMTENCAERISVVDIANSVGLGRRTLERRCKAHLGRSVVDELNRMRVERMKRLLVETDHTIKHLTGDVGFGCLEHMRAVFRKLEAMTPSQYRRQHAKN